MSGSIGGARTAIPGPPEPPGAMVVTCCPSPTSSPPRRSCGAARRSFRRLCFHRPRTAPGSPWRRAGCGAPAGCRGGRRAPRVLRPGTASAAAAARRPARGRSPFRPPRRGRGRAADPPCAGPWQGPTPARCGGRCRPGRPRLGRKGCRVAPSASHSAARSSPSSA